MITLGQAACLVLDMQPTTANRKKAISILESTPFGVTYLNNGNHLEPFALARSIIDKNPFKYKKYPRTPPVSPILAPTEESDLKICKLEEDLETISNSSSEGLTGDYSSEGVLSMARLLFTRSNPENEELYDHVYYCNKQLYEIMEGHLPKLKEVLTMTQFGLMLNKNNQYFGDLFSKKIDGSSVRVRELFILKSLTRDSLRSPNNLFRKHVKSAKGNWVNLGYIRKSPATNDDMKRRKELLNLMAERIRKNCFCNDIYCSESSRSSLPILQRDSGDNCSVINEYKGNTQKLFSFISGCTANVRLCIIDYAGLSNDPEDVRKTISLYRSIKEVVVIHKSSIEVITRHELLHRKGFIDKFKSRQGPVHRSK
ncbi:hypothetical protein BDB01DRAFT_831312 [Pilobolus umbonatus]|nr:hypothetical protein BDB01DRAFT_831312 [Pilobolus umbonatus]